MSIKALNTAHNIYSSNPNNEQHLEALYTALLKVAHQRTRQRVDSAYAEDVAQDACLRVIDALHTYKPRADFSRWALTIINRTAADHNRTLARHAELIPTVPLDDLTETAHSLATTSPLPDSLSDTDKQLLTMIHVEGYTHRDIADQLGITLSAAKKRASRAQHNLISQSLDLGCHLSGSPIRSSRREPHAESQKRASQVHHATPASLTMGQSVIERNADDDPAIKPIVDGWRPKFRVVYGKVPDNDITFSAE